MPVSMCCSNKGCHEQMEPLLDVEADEVICSVCNKPIQATYFMKVQLKSLGQIKKNVVVKTAFSVECQYCKQTAAPNVKNRKIYCSRCGEHLDYLSAPFVQSILANSGVK